jgi:hypothetical protein
MRRAMISLYQDPWFTFRFAEARLIPRIRLEGVPPGRGVCLIKIQPNTGERLETLATARTGEAGWVELPEPIVMHAGEAFIAVPEPELP